MSPEQDPVSAETGVPTPAVSAPSAPAPSVGERLRHAREARRESLSDVAAALKLSRRQVEALESGDYDVLPGPAFVRGFLRNYARHLGLDAAALLADVPVEAAPATTELAPVSNANGSMPADDRRHSSKPLGLAVAVLLFAVFAGWYFDWFQARSPGVAGGDAALPSLEREVPSEELPPAASEPSVSPSAASQPVVSAPIAVAPVVAPSAVGTSEETQAERAQVESNGLVFVFAGESWVEVRNAAGEIVYTGTGSAGARHSVQGTAPFSLVIGNAKDVRLEYKGKPIDLVPHTRVSVARLTVQ